MTTRCETCDRPYLSQNTKANIWGWVLTLMLFLAVFFAGAVVETICNLDLIGFLLVTAGYSVGVGVMVLWWQVAAKDY